jgi:hypothetical protein
MLNLRQDLLSLLRETPYPEKSDTFHGGILEAGPTWASLKKKSELQIRSAKVRIIRGHAWMIKELFIGK